MRVVVDTNVLVSGALSPHGPPGRILDLVVSGALTLLYDDRILLEYRGVLFRDRFALDPADVKTLIDHIEWSGEFVPAAPLAIQLPDEDDLPFVEVAVAGMAGALVTGNGAHFEAARRAHDLRIMSPRAFLDGLAG